MKQLFHVISAATLLAAGSLAVAAELSAGSKALVAANAAMHEAMAVEMTGDVDVDFMRTMIPHHEGAVEMAKIVIENGKDPEVRKLAEMIPDSASRCGCSSTGPTRRSPSSIGMTPTLIYKTRSFARTGEYSVDSLWSNRDTIDIMPNGLATDTLKLSLIIKTRGGVPYAKSVRASIGGLVRLDNR